MEIIKWLKQNAFNIINLLILMYLLVELNQIKKLAEETQEEAVLNNVKLDFVESDINTKYLEDTSIKK